MDTEILAFFYNLHFSNQSNTIRCPCRVGIRSVQFCLVFFTLYDDGCFYYFVKNFRTLPVMAFKIFGFLFYCPLLRFGRGSYVCGFVDQSPSVESLRRVLDGLPPVLRRGIFLACSSFSLGEQESDYSRAAILRLQSGLVFLAKGSIRKTCGRATVFAFFCMLGVCSACRVCYLLCRIPGYRKPL